MALEIRPVGRHELKAVSKLHHDVWAETYAGVYPEWFLNERSSEFFHGLWQTFLDDDQRLINAAVLDSRLCGFVRYGRPSAGSKPRSESTGELLTMYVLPTDRGKGIGTGLLRHAEARMFELGYRDALLFVVREITRSVSFYEANGWRWDGEVECTDFGGYGPESLRMEKVLNILN